MTEAPTITVRADDGSQSDWLVTLPIDVLAEDQPIPEPPARPAAGDTRTDRERLREALLTHHPIMRSETGPLSGCRCGQVRLGQDVIAHVVNELHAALSGTP